MADTIITEQRKLAASGRIVLFILDLSVIGVNEQLYFHNGVQNNFEPIVFQGKIYTPWGIEAEGFEKSGDTLPKPTLKVRNFGFVISSTIRQSGSSLIGAKLTRKRTYEKFLDGRPTANPVQEYQPDIFYISRKKSENRGNVEFELASNLELQA